MFENNSVTFDYLDEYYQQCPAQHFCISYKYDGCSLSLYYKQGTLTQALTKGKKGIGEDVLANVLKCQNVVPEIPGFDGILKAEVVFKLSDLEKLPYANARNGINGAIKAECGNNLNLACLYYYGIASSNQKFMCEADKFVWLKKYFRDVHYTVALDLNEIKEIYYEILKKRNQLDYEIDGIILTLNSFVAQGYFKSCHTTIPQHTIALKFPYQKQEAVLKNIIWQVGVTGRITPIAIIEPIFLGVTIKRVTLCNINKIKQLKLAINDIILIGRRGDVIPAIEANLTPHSESEIPYPKQCPSCGQQTSLSGAYLCCVNALCPARNLKTKIRSK